MACKLRRTLLIATIAGLLALFAGSTVSSHEEDHEGPSFEVQVLRDAVAGWNILIVTDLRFAPEHVSTATVEGEGHAHVYVDGVKVSRIYGMWHYLNDLEPGTHEIRVELSNNDHTTIVTGDHVLEQTVTIEQPEPAEPVEGPEPREVPAGLPTPAVTAEAVHDPAGGFNLKIGLENFDLAAVKASREPADGEGHARLYMDGEYVTRIYAEWTQLTGLEVGRHEISVALVANDHAPLTHDRNPIRTTFTLDVTEESLAAGGEHIHPGSGDSEHDTGEMGDMGDGEHDHPGSGDSEHDMGDMGDMGDSEHDMGGTGDMGDMGDGEPMHDTATG
jgi:hypothetical protein